jgi:N6-adenosine-specific RNA methylase IME4
MISRLVDTATLKIHPLAHIVPEMRSDEWNQFLADVKLAGIRVPLEVIGDVVIDGRHRLKAAQFLGLNEVPVVDAPVNGDPPEVYMMKAAVLRRHLTDDQRACLAVNWKDENNHQGARTDLQIATSAGTPCRSSESAIDTRAATRDLFNISRTKIEKATQVKNSRPDLFEKVGTGDIALSNAFKQVKGAEERVKIENTKPPTGLYQVIVIDPPWQYDNRQSDPTHRAASPYEMMSIEDIKKLVIPAAEDSILWLWVTNSFLPDGFHLLEEWGFTYHTTLTWAKDFIGLGDWLAGQTEHCLLATKGNYRVSRYNESTLLTAPKTHHSEKPDSFYSMVAKLCPGTRIDMFARKPHEGFESWGAEKDAR